MHAGQLDRTIYIQQNVGIQDTTYGTTVDNWVSIVNEAGSPTVPRKIWAQFQDVLPSRSDSVRQGLEVARNQSRVRIRYRSDVTSAMRVVDCETGTVYQIVGGPATLGRRQWLEMVVERFSS
jgi:head-tail adaptor